MRQDTAVGALTAWWGRQRHKGSAGPLKEFCVLCCRAQKVEAGPDGTRGEGRGPFVLLQFLFYIKKKIARDLFENTMKIMFVLIEKRRKQSQTEA